MLHYDAALRLVRGAARRILRAPGFAATTTLTLTLAIGANSFVFSIVHGVLFRPLPYRDPGALVQLTTRDREGRGGAVSLADFDDWQARTGALERLALYGTSDVALGGASGADAVRAATVSSDFFDALGVPAARGRLLEREDDRTAVAVVSWRTWLDRFGASPDLIGGSIVVNGEPTTVVGVAPPDLRFPSEDIALWMPIGHVRASAPPQWSMRGFRAFSAIGRLKAGTTPAQAKEDLARIAGDLESAYPRFNRGIAVDVVPLAQHLTASSRGILLLLWAAVGLFLVVACANVASLSLASAASRRIDVALRSALGATRGRLVSERLVESIVLGAPAILLGVGLAAALRASLLAFPPAGMPRLADVRLDAPVLAVTAIVGLLAAVASGIVPALRAARQEPAGLLRAARLATGRGFRRAGTTLTIAQLAISVALLVASAALARSLVSQLSVDTGIHGSQVVTAKLSLTPAAYADVSRQATFRDAVLRTMQRTPGVRSSAFISSLPPATSEMRTTVTARATAKTPARDVPVDIVAVTPNALPALGVPLLRGRVFAESDTSAAPRVAVLSALAARKLFPDVDPVGREVPFGMAGDGPTVVGIVGDVRYEGLEAPVEGAMYVPASQRPFRTQYLIARVDGPPTAYAGVLREAVRAADPAVAASQVRTFAQVRSDAVAGSWFRTLVLGAITGLGVLLAGVGLYGVIAQLAAERVHEFGIRIALGATRAQLAAMLLREGARLAAAGIVAGVALTFLLRSLAAPVVQRRASPDGAAFAAAIAFVVLVTIVATAIPAWRATRLGPMDALRS